MCLGIPGEIVEIDGMNARAKFWDVEKSVRLDIVDDQVEEGDYILNHAGFAIRKIPDDQVDETIEIYEAFLEGDEDDALEEIGATNERLGIQRMGDPEAAPSTPGSSDMPGPQGTDPDPRVDEEGNDDD